MILTAVLCVIYFFQITQASARGVELKHLSERKSSLTGETYRLDLNIAEESSAHNLQKRVSELGLSSARNIEYVTADSHSVAVK
ncbi:MAG: hypothetical protein A3C15_02300 [Candidatus Magasanikbacteria bacterium RIFCSPHIGHO2_02_FULL_50_9b]|uniref:Uncharacterized protein n=1 Tax=Candidatus Magasanikbacteria bacterium RIFCSPHIGHO2_02_FULL_50_9b TaxID=1798682 RepID=A0A1F6M8Z5_9BACT|nr:MAG: hypothetical protein A3C15_02300 [Candidatus Magasanikbacteria bacterium RIFCSPHIGHO2_02_FULL_50_9b]